MDHAKLAELSFKLDSLLLNYIKKDPTVGGVVAHELAHSLDAYRRGGVDGMLTDMNPHDYS